MAFMKHGLTSGVYLDLHRDAYWDLRYIPELSHVGLSEYLGSTW